jgi:hypothetical protein
VTDAVVVLELRRLAAMVAAQADEIAELRRCLLDKRDRRIGARLVPAIWRVTDGRPFDAATLAAATLNARSPAAATVAAAIADHVDVDDGLRGFGRLLHRLHGARFGDLRLVPAPGGRWRVEGGFSAK